ncbi:MAG: hypothetical protein OXG82_20520 [Gammaproteobacteria bacterium]|nr:hypothetical protein [Gammaproteobacteria bacterium]
MLRTLRISLIVPLGVLGLATHGDGSHDQRLEAILAAGSSVDVVCDYTYTHAGSQRPVVTESYSSSDGWRLAEINGRPPSPKELAVYESDERKQSRARRNAPRFELRSHVDPDSLVITSEDDDTLTVAFAPPASKDKDEDLLMRKLGVKMRGSLIVRKPGLRLLTMTLALAEPVAIAIPPVRVHEYTETRTFVIDSTTGATLVRSFEFHSRGRAFYVKKLQNSSMLEYSYANCRSDRMVTER